MSQPHPFDQVLKDINKKYGEGTICRASEARRVKVLRVPFGVPILDAATGGGAARGRMTMLRGQESSGKSLLLLRLIIESQSVCRYCATRFRFVDRLTGESFFDTCKCGKCEPHLAAWVDVEGAWTNDWFAGMGGNPDLVLVTQPDYGEQIVDVTDHLIRSRAADIIGVDSLAAIIPSVEVEASAEKEHMGQQPRLLTKAYRKWQSALNAGSLLEELPPPALVYVNQLRFKIGVVYGNPVTSPGGEAMNKFGPSLIVDTKRKKPLGPPEMPFGQNVSFIVSKNKTAAPWRNGEYAICFREGNPLAMRPGETDTHVQLVRLGLLHGLIEKKGSWYTVEGERFQGEANAAQAVLEDGDLYQKLYTSVMTTELGYVP